MLTFSVQNNKTYVTGEEVQLVREKFSVENKAAKFSRYNSSFLPYRKYLITPKGRFDVGLYFEIKKYINENHPDIRCIKTPEFNKIALPTLQTPVTANKLLLEPRGYQSTIVSACTRVGRGVVVLATAGGKTLTMASLIQRVYDNYRVPGKFKCLVLVPDIGLVNQTYGDFKEYGCKFHTNKWTGNTPLDLNCNVIVANMGILQSKKSDTDWLRDIDLLIVDEVHKLRSGNKINKVLDKIVTCNRYGFTGTMPEEMEDQWNIIGKIGPVLYEKNSFQLRQEKYIAKARVLIVKISYNSKPKSTYNAANFNPSDRYRNELVWLQNNSFRNRVICKLCSNVENNSLLLVDRIEHGVMLEQELKRSLKNKIIYFIRGEVEVEQREKIRKMMEIRHDIVCVAISKIFSTGINIRNLHYIMFCSGGKAKVKIVQSIGRGLRKHDTKDKLIIIDLADQLHYGKQHMNKRLKLYDSENFKYDYQQIQEKN